MLNTRPAQGALHGKAQQHSLHARLPHLRPVAPKGWLAQAADADSTITATHESIRPANVRVASHEVAEAASTAPPSIASSINPTTLAIAGAVALGAYGIKKIYDTPSRTYNNNVGDEYDSWTQEGILEYYWGEHIHLGYYSEEERKQGYLKKNFKQAKFDFVDEMFNFSESATPTKILDVGCGIGGTSRHLAKKFPGAQVKGITLSPNQVKRGTQLAKDQGLDNASFQVMDALNMEFEDNTFDLVWACESGEHMPDKKKYVEEMVRVLKPGGTLVIACWCQREETPEAPLTQQDKEELQFLYDEWAHPFFISPEEFERLMQGTGKMQNTSCDDWTPQTIDSWRHSIWVGVFDPWIVISKPWAWYKVTREIVTLERMHRAFDKGLMQYGMIRGVKAPLAEPEAAGSSSAAEGTGSEAAPPAAAVATA